MVKRTARYRAELIPHSGVKGLILTKSFADNILVKYFKFYLIYYTCKVFCNYKADRKIFSVETLYHTEINQMIYNTNKLTDFYMMRVSTKSVFE